MIWKPADVLPVSKVVCQCAKVIRSIIVTAILIMNFWDGYISINLFSTCVNSEQVLLPWSVSPKGGLFAEEYVGASPQY